MTEEEKRKVEILNDRIKKFESLLNGIFILSILAGLTLAVSIWFMVINTDVQPKKCDNWRADYYSAEDMLEDLENESTRNAE